MIKNILLVLTGFIIGGAVGVGGVYFMYTKTILPAAIDDLGIAENFNPEETSKNIANMKKVDALIPKTLVDQNYHVLFEQIVNSANLVAKNNNESIYPAMQILKEKSKTGNWDGIFDIVVDIRSTIKTNQEIIATMNENLETFREENNSTTKDTNFREKSALFAESGKRLASSYTGYFGILSQFITGKTPTKELADNLNVRIKDLSDKNTDFQQKINAMYVIIDAENAKIEQQQAQ